MTDSEFQKQVLSQLKTLTTQQQTLAVQQIDMSTKLGRIESDLDTVKDHVIDLKQGQKSLENRMDRLERGQEEIMGTLQQFPDTTDDFVNRRIKEELAAA